MMGREIDFGKKRRFELPEGGTVAFRLREISVKPGAKVCLGEHFDPAFTGGLSDKAAAVDHVTHNIDRLAGLQERLYAQGSHALLVVLQGIDTSGKDGMVRHVFSGVNPQGCTVTSFKAPSTEELEHDYLWRVSRALPRRGMIAIFNRSHYEEVLAVRVHPEFLARQNLPLGRVSKELWKRRYREINDFESYLAGNAISIVKIFLNISQEEQRRRLLARINDPDKQWKFSDADVRERSLWEEYQKAYSAMLSHTSTKAAPWFVIPSNHKWFARLAVSEILCAHLERLGPEFPAPSVEQLAALRAAKTDLEREAGQ